MKCDLNLATIGLLLLMSVPASAQEAPDRGKTELTADFRFRFESDWDSQTSDGEQRNDRTRARIRARVGAVFAPTPSVELGIRIRTGSDDSHQSSHVTLLDFDNNPTGDKDLNFDKWYLKASRGNASGWVGRNSFPFWKRNELLWDDDVTVAGFAGALARPLGGDGKLTLNLAYVSLPVGMQEFAGNLTGGQLVWTRSGSQGFTMAAGFFDLASSASDSDAARLLRGNGQRDYQIVVVNGQLRSSLRERALVLGLDLFHNAENYSAADPDPFTVANRDQTDGFAASFRWGQTKSKGDWLVGYYYAEIETFAVHASYAQDDFARWGSAVEARLSDFSGHELRYARALGASFDLVARLYLVESITSQEDGNRFRLDLNYKFGHRF